MDFELLLYVLDVRGCLYLVIQQDAGDVCDSALVLFTNFTRMHLRTLWPLVIGDANAPWAQIIRSCSTSRRNSEFFSQLVVTLNGSVCQTCCNNCRSEWCPCFSSTRCDLAVGRPVPVAVPAQPNKSFTYM